MNHQPQSPIPFALARRMLLAELLPDVAGIPAGLEISGLV